MPFASISIRTDRYGRLRRRSRSRSPSNRRTNHGDARDDRRRSRSRDRQRRSIERVSSSKHKTSTDNDAKKAPPPPMASRIDRETSLMRQVATLSGLTDPSIFDKEEEQKLLEDEMQQRRQRIEKWRAARNSDTKANNAAVANASNTNATMGPTADGPGITSPSLPPTRKMKKWTNEDDDDEGTLWTSLKKKGKTSTTAPVSVKVKQEVTVVPAAPVTAPEDDTDPLDAFMTGVQEEVTQLKQRTQHQVITNKSGAKVSVVSNPQQEQTLSGPTTTATTSGVSSAAVTAKAKAAAVVKKLKGELVSLDPEDALSALMPADDESSAAAQPGSSTARDLADIAQLAGGLQGTLSKQQKLSKAFNHQNTEYAPFRKDFYREADDVARMTDEQVAVLRDQLDGIVVRGKSCPKPITIWAHAGVSPITLAKLRKENYEKPTPIQAQAIPCIMSGRDVIGIAKTGSGKTLAFILPFLRHCADQPPLAVDDGPIGLIMAPTRELVMQIGEECIKFCKPLGFTVACVYGGVDLSNNIAILKRGAHLVVCTPGRMIELLLANNGRVTNLRRVTYLVLDEADRMFDQGFEQQIMMIIDNMRPDRQMVLFSATFPPSMEALAKRSMDPQRLIQIRVGGKTAVASDVEQHCVLLDEDQKFLKLLELIGRYTSTEAGGGLVLVFVDRQEKADMLLKDLMRASYTVMALHGGVDQSDRGSIINDFKNGNISILVATSVAARGLDVKNLTLVVNYDCPNHYEDYVHRCGRTGRAGNKGVAFTFITPQQERFTPDLVQGFEAAKQLVPYDLRVMYEMYKAQLLAEGKQIKGGSGFGGRGFKFDSMELAVAKESRKQQLALTAGPANDDDDHAEGTAGRLDAEIEGLFKSTRRVRDGRPGAGFVAAALDAAAASTAPKSTEKNSIDIGQKLLMAQKRATQIRQEKVAAEAEKLSVDAMLRAADATTKFIASQTASARSVAEQVAEKIHVKLNYIRDEVPKIAEGSMLEEEQAQTYEEELDINDFPQQVRFKLTMKDVIGSICEFSETYVSIRGLHIPPGKQPKAGERRLHLLIEGLTEMAVSKAKMEIIRIVKEELLKMQHAPVMKTSRYKVV